MIKALSERLAQPELGSSPSASRRGTTRLVAVARIRLVTEDQARGVSRSILEQLAHCFVPPNRLPGLVSNEFIELHGEIPNCH
jgi:hypothetical protein